MGARATHAFPFILDVTVIAKRFLPEAIPNSLIGDCFVAPLFRNLICGADGSSAWAGKLPAATVLTSSLPYTRHARRDLLAMTP